ncbi:aconitate hydratase AcnA [Paenibacillus camerounensis]|uniref:aconitate hydratase AcnA n=1 Tax=Paenibacillus camerounensis TaxID=1243663 RepID=UPI0005A70FC7|nr:aconitate hydratase AcnA [Paenibacillus camerounensis]
MTKNPFEEATAHLEVNGQRYEYFKLDKVEKYQKNLEKLPITIKILLEGAIRNYNGWTINENHVDLLGYWTMLHAQKEVPFFPSRVVLQDLTGLPALIDLAAMRETLNDAGIDPKLINPVIPVDLVIDHSVMVDSFGTPKAREINETIEFARNEERYQFFRWAQSVFSNLNIIPPDTGIVHQINLEYLSQIVATKQCNDKIMVYPDSLVGTDSHTTMINGLGVLGWGVGGIEAEAGMLGEPLYFVQPEVIGFKLIGKLQEGSTATDLALTITQQLRLKDVVGKFIEFYGPGLNELSLEDRATIANMAPEYGATTAYFPVDSKTLHYLHKTGRSEDQVQLIKEYFVAQGIFRTEDFPDPLFTDTVELDLSTVTTSIAGPKRPQDRMDLFDIKRNWNNISIKPVSKGGYGLSPEQLNASVNVQLNNGKKSCLTAGAVVLAALTSCTNTSNASVMIAAGLLARKAVELGLIKQEYVKTSFTPGSLVVTEYLIQAGLMEPLERLGFHLAGYGCATCIGNSGPLPEEISSAIAEHNLTVASVLSGNRNFEGRIHPQIKANYLASPPLVVAFALAGRVNIDFKSEPIGYDSFGKAVYLADIWPTSIEIAEIEERVITRKMYRDKYRDVYTQNKRWNMISSTQSELYAWDNSSTYIVKPPFFDCFNESANNKEDIKSARVLLLLGDSVTTDHISPAGSIRTNSPAGEYLRSFSIIPEDYNSYGSRRGNHHVMVRGTFANNRIRNELLPATEGGFSMHLPDQEVGSVYNTAMKYRMSRTALLVIAGKEYGTGSSRDWAAKGALLLGIKAVLAESFERIHRSNLVGMGVLPLQFTNGETAKSLGLTGREVYDIIGLIDELEPGGHVTINVTREDATVFKFKAIVRIDSKVELVYYSNGGMLNRILRTKLMKK